MINFITKYFTSLWAFITSPFRAIWRLIIKIFPPREFTVMDIPRGNVYTFSQSSFWRFTKFCAKVGLIVWAAWSTYVFLYHRPMLQSRTMQLEQLREKYARHMIDLQQYLSKYNELVKNLNVIDDKLAKDKKLTDKQKESLMNDRLKTWGELDFLKTRVTEMFTEQNYNPEFIKLSDLAIEFELTRAENAEIKKRDEEVVETASKILDVDNKIVDTVSKLASDQIADLRKELRHVNGTLATLGLGEGTLVANANKYSNPLVGAVFNPLETDKSLDEKYQKLAKNITLWNGLNKLKDILPLGAPVKTVRVTSKYGVRKDPFTGEKKTHKGIDFAGKIGTELMAVAPGRVISAGDRVGYGTTVEIDHGLGFTTLYAHLSKVTVSRGDWVRPGTIVGLGGSSGRSTGPHLHYEIRYKGNPFNPEKFVKE
ncbi:MAG: peptidoglycan DD-metalloendopeptidase family protein [Alphaproteobacteria bacterium]|nr:peptidoglycan DD-metalloendopeptidase family protein [Alphaproteobacteria bacterium]